MPWDSLGRAVRLMEGDVMIKCSEAILERFTLAADRIRNEFRCEEELLTTEENISVLNARQALIDVWKNHPEGFELICHELLEKEIQSQFKGMI